MVFCLIKTQIHDFDNIPKNAIAVYCLEVLECDTY